MKFLVLKNFIIIAHYKSLRHEKYAWRISKRPITAKRDFVVIGPESKSADR